MIQDLPERIYRDADGYLYRVALAPMEQGIRSPRLGVDRRLNAIVFEREDGSWMGSAPIYHTRTLWELTGEEMERYLEIAIGRG